MLILNKFFLKYEGGGGSRIDPLPQKKLPSKYPALLRLSCELSFNFNFCCYLKLGKMDEKSSVEM